MASAVHETDAADIAREAVRVLRHHLHGIGAVGPEYPHRPRRADAVAVQEHHDLADHLLLGPGIGDALRPDTADAGHLAQAFGLGLDDVEDLLAERPDQLAGVDRADAPDHPRAEILLDALDRGRLGGAHEARLELLTVGAVVDPLARCGDPLPRSHHGGVADHRHQVAMPPRLRPEHAESVLGIVEGDALDQPGQDLPVRGLWMLAGAGFHDVPGAGAVSSSFTGRAPSPAPARFRNLYGRTQGNSDPPPSWRAIQPSCRPRHVIRRIPVRQDPCMAANRNGARTTRLPIRGHGPGLLLRDSELADRDRLAFPLTLQLAPPPDRPARRARGVVAQPFLTQYDASALRRPR